MTFSTLIKKVFLCDDAGRGWVIPVFAGALATVAVFGFPSLIVGGGMYAMRSGLDFETTRLLVIGAIAIVGAGVIGASVVLSRWARRNHINL